MNRMMAEIISPADRLQWSAMNVPISGETIVAANCMLCATPTNIALYSTGTVCMRTSKKTRSKPAWKIPAMPAKIAICQVDLDKAIKNG